MKLNVTGFNEVQSYNKETEKHTAVIITDSSLIQYDIRTTFSYNKSWAFGYWIAIDLESVVEIRQIEFNGLEEKWKLFLAETSL